MSYNLIFTLFCKIEAKLAKVYKHKPMKNQSKYKRTILTMIEMNIYDKQVKTFKSKKKELTPFQRQKLLKLKQRDRMNKIICKKLTTNRSRKLFDYY